MPILVGFASRRGGTAGLAAMIGAELNACLNSVCDIRPLGTVRDLASYQAAIIAGAIYMDRWLVDARRFVRANAEVLRGMPTWLVASGPLNDSATKGQVPPNRDLGRAAALIEARGTQVFGGRLEPDAQGTLAARMARTQAGDWRDPGQVERWVQTLLPHLDPEPIDLDATTDRSRLPRHRTTRT